jgi:hypothetical protein
MMITEKKKQNSRLLLMSKLTEIKLYFRFRNHTEEKETNNQPKQQQTNLFIMKLHHELKP